jgi:cholest-4-en-3-one 26-monooxygenase
VAFNRLRPKLWEDFLKLAEIDVVSNDVYLTGVPHDQFAFLRKHAPVHRQIVPDPELQNPVWVITRPAEIQRISEDPETYSSAYNITLRRLAEELLTVVRPGNMIEQDDPEHRRLRLIVAPAFLPRVVRTFTDHYRDLTSRVLAKAISQESFDFVTEVAAELPLLAICELLGAPETDRAKIFRWTNVILGAEDPEYGHMDLMQAGMEVTDYVLALADEKRRAPGPDLLSALVSLPDDQCLTNDELAGFIMLLMLAGNETTRNNLAGGIVALIEHPDQLAALRAHPDDLLDSAVEEITRWVSPVNYMARMVTRDTVLAGQKIPAGEKVAMFYPSANRDEETFPGGTEFDITHRYQRHFAFGFGRHFCLGAHLARIETKLVLAELLAVTKDIRLAAPIQRQRSSFVSGIKHLPVTTTPA